jgi:hypothetical protein
MATDCNKFYIDEDSYMQITNEDEEGFKSFLDRNKKVVDITPRKKVLDSNITGIVKEKPITLESIDKKEELVIKHQKDDDHRYIFCLFWLEQYLPRFELAFGEFHYSKEGLSNKEKCIELQRYFEDVCKIKNVEDIRKKSVHTMKDVIKGRGK